MEQVLRVTPEHKLILRPWVAHHLLNLLKLLLGLIELTQRQQVIPKVQAGVTLALRNGEVSIQGSFNSLHVPHPRLLMVLEFAV